VFAIWGLSRIVTTVLVQLFAAAQPANQWTGAHPNYLAFAQLWDSTWYHIVAVNGYPSVLPVDASGYVGQNAWAFLPAYPILVRMLMVLTTLPWEPVSVAVSFIFSFAATLVFSRLMALRLPPGTALFSVILFCTAPLSPILQVSYAESMFLFLIALALYLILTRRYALLFPVIVLAGLTRPSVLVLALALGGHVIIRWVRRKTDPFPAIERALTVGATLCATVMGFAWPLIAWAVTGNPSAYTDTELAWRTDYIGHQMTVLPFAPWIQGAVFWAGQWGIGVWSFVLLVVVVAGFCAALFLPSVRRLGSDLRLWVASYGLYLLAVFFPQSSTFRLLMPMFPLLGAVAQPRSPTYRVGIVALMIAGQVVWLYICWWVNGYDWTPP